MKGDALDPKALIREAFAIEGITDAECRSILVDWALSLPGDSDPTEALSALHRLYAPLHPGHPMTVLLAQGRAAQRPMRRGGSRARRH